MNAPIRIVLDSTAIAAYADRSIAVGEIITQVGEENSLVALPVACLAEAFLHIHEGELPLVAVLAAHPSTVVVNADVSDWLDLAGLARDLGRVDAATALMLALRTDGYILTKQPGLYDGFEGAPVIPF
ncbi:hypothetical protein [Plantactinospora sp. WMMB782]|uniref:hypothetical protein n=1 Tax=Plantactinospora sp. WMMB782 TaxID=3404121 RepID=UPI003B929564